MKLSVKAFSLALTLVLLISATPVSAESSGVQTWPQRSLEEIFDQYHTQIRAAEIIADARSGNALLKSTSNLQTAKTTAKAEAISALTSAGYEAYDVNPSSFYDIEELLQTDFAEMELCPDFSYIVVIGDGDSQTRGAGPSYFYTYNGTTYSLRTFSITAADDPNYAKSSYANVLSSSSTTLIQNCLDTSIYAVLGSISPWLGAVAGICGLSVSMFGTAQSSTLLLNGAANWTRVYTQVLSASGVWLSSSCIESVHVLTYMSGSYYNASSNSMKPVPTNESTTTQYSTYYSDGTWRNQYAVIGHNAGIIVYDPGSFPSVKFSYGGTVKITLTVNF